MAMSRAERLTAQFYNWELRGRGWDAWPEPVDLEPQFWPFFGHADPAPDTAQDDGRRPTFMSSLAESIALFLRPGQEDGELVEDGSSDESYEPVWIESPTDVEEVCVALPPGIAASKDTYEQFLSGFGSLSRPAAFEIVGREDSVAAQFALAPEDGPTLRSQLSAYFPDAALPARDSTLRDLWEGNDDQEILEYGLSWEFMRPLRRFSRFDPDPLGGVVAAMTDLRSGETAVYQVLFRPAVNRWTESILRAVSDGRGGSFFADDPAMLRLAGEKVASPMYGVVVRVAAKAPDPARARRIAAAIGGALRVFTDPRSNELVPLEPGHDPGVQAADLLLRQSRRSGMLLNAEELMSLAHLPSASVKEPKLVRYAEKSKRAPEIAEDHSLALGVNEHAGKAARVTQSPSQRLKHTYVIGASGTGKSTLLLNLILQDVESGDGLAVLDPHGDLIEEILGRVPEGRTDDVILIDPAEEEFSVGFNILAAHSEVERNLLESDLVSVFQRLSTSWGDQMTTVFGNAVLAFLESGRGGTLADLRRFLVEAKFREEFLRSVSDPDVLYYWQKEFPLLRGKPQSPILTRLSTFLRPKAIRRMVTQEEKCLDFARILAERKIVLAKLSHGLIGEENSYLLGTLLVSKLNQAATARQRLRDVDRTPFYLYIDEFHNFVTPSMSAILSGARKYGLGLILAHQDLQQIATRDSALAGAVISNPYTRICFRLGDYDAKKLEDGFSSFSARDLQNLSVGRAVCRMERAEYDFNLRTEVLEPLEPAVVEERRERVRARSRELYAVRSAEIAPRAVGASPEKGEGEQPRARETARHRVDPLLECRPSDVPPSTGRGGSQHQYLQHLVKRWAEESGYRASVEHAVLDGLGSVDVALFAEEFSVACEICVTTSPEHELDNIRKCLSAGFDHVVALSTTRKTLDRIACVAEELEPSERTRVRYFLPEELFGFLESRRAERSPDAEQTVRGYRVKVTRKQVSTDEQDAKRRVIAGAVLKSLRKLRD